MAKRAANARERFPDAELPLADLAQETGRNVNCCQDCASATVQIPPCGSVTNAAARAAASARKNAASVTTVKGYVLVYQDVCDGGGRRRGFILSGVKTESRLLNQCIQGFLP